MQIHHDDVDDVLYVRFPNDFAAPPHRRAAG